MKGNLLYSDVKQAAAQDMVAPSLPIIPKYAVIGYWATIFMRHLHIQVGAKLFDHVWMHQNPFFHPYLARIWPAHRPRDWPPGLVMTAEALGWVLRSPAGQSAIKSVNAPPELYEQVAARIQASRSKNT
jgi:hypothetical protein